MAKPAKPQAARLQLWQAAPMSIGGRGLKIGLLGGSFNPAHDGHRHISLMALKRLGLDQVWWLVTPQNPLKNKDDLDALEARLESARTQAHHPRIKVTALEDLLGTRYTADTLAALRTRWPKLRFVWLMGADNLSQIPRWRGWTEIFTSVPVAILARPNYSVSALVGKAAKRFAGARVQESQAAGLALTKPPAWVFLHIPLHHASATRIRVARSFAKEGKR